MRVLYSGVQDTIVSVNANDPGQEQGSGDSGNEDSWVNGPVVNPATNIGTQVKVQFSYYWFDGDNPGAGLQQVTTDSAAFVHDSTHNDSFQIGVFYNKHNHRDDEGQWRVKINGNVAFQHNIDDFNDDPDNIANMTVKADGNVPF